MSLRLFYQFPTWMQRLYRGVVWRLVPDNMVADASSCFELSPYRGNGRGAKVIYLTFDDGCIPEVTPKVLAILAQYGVKATFFMVGDNIRKYPAIFKQVQAAGHSIGNHTYHHVKGTHLSLEKYLQEVEACDKLLHQHGVSPQGGTEGGLLFRPPYGKMSFVQKRILSQSHTIVLWDLLTHDYNPRFTPERIMRAIRRYSRNGSIVVFHDSLKAQKNMLAVLPEAIEFWQAEGYELRTL